VAALKLKEASGHLLAAEQETHKAEGSVSEGDRGTDFKSGGRFRGMFASLAEYERSRLSEKDKGCSGMTGFHGR
jgi:hypothetical protein